MLRAQVLVYTGLNASPLLDPMLEVLGRWARKLDTANAWFRLADSAYVVSRDVTAREAATRALQRDATHAGAALVLAVVANRGGDHDTALRVITDIGERVPSLKNEPPFLIQLAIAEIARGRSQAALAVIDGALPRLAASDSRFDAYVLRGRLLAAMPARAAEAVGAWEQSLAAARHPVHADLARVGLIDALSRAQRPAEALRQLDQGLAQTSNAALRSSWLDARPNLLAATGDIDAAMIAFDERVAASTDPDRRAELRLRKRARRSEAAARRPPPATTSPCARSPRAPPIWRSGSARCGSKRYAASSPTISTAFSRTSTHSTPRGRPPGGRSPSICAWPACSLPGGKTRLWRG